MRGKLQVLVVALGVIAGGCASESASVSAPWLPALVELAELTLAVQADHGADGEGCDGHEIGQRWARACNDCFCSELGEVVCTRKHCASDGSGLGVQGGIRPTSPG